MFLLESSGLFDGLRGWAGGALGFHSLGFAGPVSVVTALRPIIAVQASGAVPSERSFVGGAANGWDWWFCDDRLSGDVGHKRIFRSCLKATAARPYRRR
jgi:hypothetical protein